MRPGRLLLWVLVAVALARLASLGLYPLLDTTEARYGEIGRKMLASGNWLTPQWDVGVPFWGKPPLSFWASAASMAVFGVNEFTASCHRNRRAAIALKCGRCMSVAGLLAELSIS